MCWFPRYCSLVPLVSDQVAAVGHLERKDRTNGQIYGTDVANLQSGGQVDCDCSIIVIVSSNPTQIQNIKECWQQMPRSTVS